jgi:hypothetical protein
MPPKRHQTLNIRDNQARYPRSIKSPQADFVTRYGRSSFTFSKCQGFYRASRMFYSLSRHISR